MSPRGFASPSLSAKFSNALRKQIDTFSVWEHLFTEKIIKWAKNDAYNKKPCLDPFQITKSINSNLWLYFSCFSRKANPVRTCVLTDCSECSCELSEIWLSCFGVIWVVYSHVLVAKQMWPGVLEGAPGRVLCEDYVSRGSAGILFLLPRCQKTFQALKIGIFLIFIFWQDGKWISFELPWPSRTCMCTARVVWPSLLLFGWPKTHQYQVYSELKTPFALLSI